MEVSELQEEMACGAAALEELSAQLEEERVRSNPSAANATLQKVWACTCTTYTCSKVQSLNFILIVMTS